MISQLQTVTLHTLEIKKKMICKRRIEEDEDMIYSMKEVKWLLCKYFQFLHINFQCSFSQHLTSKSCWHIYCWFTHWFDYLFLLITYSSQFFSFWCYKIATFWTCTFCNRSILYLNMIRLFSIEKHALPRGLKSSYTKKVNTKN